MMSSLGLASKEHAQPLNSNLEALSTHGMSAPHLSCFQITLVKGTLENTVTSHSAFKTSTQLHRLCVCVKGDVEFHTFSFFC